MISRDRIETTVRRNPGGSITVVGTLTLRDVVEISGGNADELYAIESAKHQVRNLVLGEMYASLREPVDALYWAVARGPCCNTDPNEWALINKKFQALADLVNCRVITVQQLKKNEH